MNTNTTETTTTTISSTGSVRCSEVVVPAGNIDLSQVVNLTPHPINISEEGGKVKLVRKDLGDLAGLPAPVPGKGVVVSLAAAQKAWAEGRDDVLCIGETLRSPDGKVIGATSLGVGPRGFIPA
jgi:hypothetical protein